MMEVSKIITPIHIYLLELLNMDYISLPQSFVDKDGMVYLNLDVSKLPIPDIIIDGEYGLKRKFKTVLNVLELLFDTTFVKNGCSWSEKHFLIKKSDMFYIQFNPMTGMAESFAITHNGKTYVRTHEYIKGTLYFMEVLGFPEYALFNQKYIDFNNKAIEWVKQQLRAIMIDLQGFCYKDKIDYDTYFQLRNVEKQDVFYIINKWWKQLKNDDITWVDITNGDENIYIALN